MTNPFPYSNTNKHYHTLSYYNRQQFGQAIYKAAIDGGFTCPNLDGTKGRGGCIYCANGSGYFTADAAVPVTEQLTQELHRIHQKHPHAKAVAYFQAHTNTYASVDHLLAVFEPALSHPDICGLTIATRADCLPPEVIAYLADLNKRTYLTVELGLQTIHDSTAEKIHRCHTYADFLQGYQALKAHAIRTCVHLICGLPEETPDMMEESARTIGVLQPAAVKLHLLHVIQKTPLFSLYASQQYTPLSMETYIDCVIRQLEVLPPETVIERITGDGDRRTLAAPLWSLDKIRVLGTIDKEMAKRNTWQGIRYIAAEI